MSLALWLLLPFIAIFLFLVGTISLFSSIDEQETSLLKRKSYLSFALRFVISRIAFINSLLPLRKYRQKVAKKLRGSGKYNYTFEEFMLFKEISFVIFFLVIYFVALDDLLLALAISILGFFLPDIYIDAEKKRREKKIIADLPYMMDLLILMVEAGADFIFAIENIIKKFPDRPLKEELKILLQTLKTGRSRREGLEMLKERIDVLDVSSLCSAMIRADELGTSLGSVLRIQSEHIKKKRSEERREKSKKAATKMIFPLVLCIFPATFILIVGALGLKVAKIFNFDVDKMLFGG